MKLRNIIILILNKVSIFLITYLKVYRPTRPYIEEGRIRSILRKSYRKVFKLTCILFDLIFLIPALLVVLIVRALRPVVLIRFCMLSSRRIGSLAANTELYLCQRDIEIKQGKRSLDLFYYTYPICNQQLKKMWSRILHVHPLVSYLYRVNACLPGGEKNSALKLNCTDRDIYGLLRNTQPHLYFTPKEIKIGNSALHKMGILSNSSFVCLYVRDSKYLEDYYKIDFYYHNYRNSNIENCKLAAEKLVERGYFIIRMGKNVKEEFKTNNPKIIDYTTNSRSDFLDIFFSARCRFFIAGPAGLGSVPMIFRRPIVWINFIPLGEVHTWGENELFIPKKLWLKKESRFMTFPEIIESGVGRFCETQQYEKYRIEVIENSPEEILAVVMEMEERLKGTWLATKEDEELQQVFWSNFKESELNHKILSRIGAEFLRQNKELLG